ncbi:MAG: restriction endonuclease subunit S [Nitrospira sp. SB0677_bin_15]|nr:restriction endonuclease subunit S [Nitrospira sp. SB0677_bin_15]
MGEDNQTLRHDDSKIESYKFPKEWCISKISNLCSQLQYGYTTKASDKGDLKLLRTTDITRGKIDWNLVPFCSTNPADPEKYLLKEGDIVISRAGSVGFSYLLEKPEDSVFASYLIRFRPYIDKKFFKYFLDSPLYWREISEKKLGIAVPNVNANKLKQIPLPVPPLPEQRRIVSKLEELLSELDKGIESFKMAREQLIVYRQAILKNAFEGKLTEEWRRKHADELESAETLLEKIKAEREQRYRQQQDDWKRAVKAWEASGKVDKKPTKPGKPKELPPLTEAELSELPKLPDGWAWIRFHNMVLESCLGKMLDKSKNVGTPIPYLRNINVRWGSFDLSDLLNMKFEEAEKERYGLQSGDLIICEGGEPGRCAIWKQSNSDMRIQKALHRVRFPTKSIANKFAYYFMLFSSSNGHLSKFFTGTTIKHLTGKGLANLEFPVSSIAEQNQIVDQIESRLSAAERLEQDIANGLKQAEALRQSLLKKAFEGRLVPQDPNDEPASVLLERIRAEKAKPKQKARKLKKVAV